MPRSVIYQKLDSEGGECCQMKVRHPFTLATKAIPRLALRPENTALVIQDFQEYFTNRSIGFGKTAKERGIQREFESYYQQVERAKEHLPVLCQRAREFHMPILFTRWAYEHPMEISMLQRAIGAMIPTTDSAAQIDPALKANADELVITKPGLGAFSSACFAEALKVRGIENLLLTGVMTEFGIRNTAQVAADSGYRVIIVHDCCAGVTLDSHRIATAEMTFGTIKVRGSREMGLIFDDLEREDVVLV